jgi:16S rRNA processing protein RimM
MACAARSACRSSRKTRMRSRVWRTAKRGRHEEIPCRLASSRQRALRREARGVNDRNASELLTNIELFVARDKLPAIEVDGEFYHADLIGLRVEDKSGKKYGVVIAVRNFGASDLIEVAEPPKKSGNAHSVPRSVRARGRSGGGPNRHRACARFVRRAKSENEMTWRASVLTLFPEMFPGPLGLSLAGKALGVNTWSLEALRHSRVRDRPAPHG